MNNTKELIQKMGVLFLNCKQATLLVVMEQEVKLSFLNRVKLYVHLNLFCKYCKTFKIQTTMLQKSINKQVQEDLTLRTNFKMNEDKKLHIAQMIEDILKV